MALSGLTAGQMVEVSSWLMLLTAANKLELITDAFVADGTAVAAIYATFQVMSRARLDGNGIQGQVRYLREFIAAPGGDADKSITTVGGQKVLTGPEIDAHALNVLTGPRPDQKVAGLEKYPKGEFLFIGARTISGWTPNPTPEARKRPTRPSGAGSWPSSSSATSATWSRRSLQQILRQR